ncbi:SAF domain-containing protein [Actinomadura harenae]|uniref:SAF domain-containing protein n=1 Tax=Actinomadura harenae TaxID=2483351 RepID=A0A3M2LNU4_9ACTN|nr:hypothetical protein EBO15_31660 [Actinomadura harenae]
MPHTRPRLHPATDQPPRVLDGSPPQTLRQGHQSGRTPRPSRPAQGSHALRRPLAGEQLHLRPEITESGEETCRNHHRPGNADSSPEPRRIQSSPEHEMNEGFGQRRRLLAALFAALGTGLALLAIQPSAPPAIRVAVAARDLAAGAALRPGDIRIIALPPAVRPDGALRNPPVGRVLAGAVRRGEALTDARVLGPGLLDDQPPGMVATPIRVADSTAARLLHPGDRIDVLTATPPGSASEPPSVPDVPTPAPSSDGPKTPPAGKPSIGAAVPPRVDMSAAPPCADMGNVAPGSLRTGTGSTAEGLQAEPTETAWPEAAPAGGIRGQPDRQHQQWCTGRRSAHPTEKGTPTPSAATDPLFASRRVPTQSISADGAQGHPMTRCASSQPPTRWTPTPPHVTWLPTQLGHAATPMRLPFVRLSARLISGRMPTRPDSPQTPTRLASLRALARLTSGRVTAQPASAQVTAQPAPAQPPGWPTSAQPAAWPASGRRMARPVSARASTPPSSGGAEARFSSVWEPTWLVGECALRVQGRAIGGQRLALRSPRVGEGRRVSSASWSRVVVSSVVVLAVPREESGLGGAGQGALVVLATSRTQAAALAGAGGPLVVVLVKD